ncbi:MAG TPA: hypothetical protein RMG45_28740, partial [Polyangiaceae bacterium LLY-WYZ-15_(1-7)]|nr:hypothetical protein [Polyangiaceae bacterium LLY-WYZ-15_(1-7)]
DGEPMDEKDWRVHYARSLGVFLHGEGIRSRDQRGRAIVDDSFYLLLSAHHEVMRFTLPEELEGSWTTLVDTAEPTTVGTLYQPGDGIDVTGRSVQLLIRPRG